MLAYLFPGQGSQSVGMGAELFEKFPDITAKADAILGYSIQSLCLGEMSSQLNQTQYTQPALFTVNALSYLNKMQENSHQPAYVAGHSLGEYNALLAADVFDFESGLKIVQKRGELMSQMTGGAMAAIIGLHADAISEIFQKHHLTNVSIANYNSHTQIVITGKKEDILQAQALCEQHDASMVIPLAVSGAFHSPFMRSAQEQFELFIKDFEFTTPKIPVIANISAKPYQHDAIRQTITNQITSSVRWTETIEYLQAQGVSDFEEIGPGKVLAGLVRRIKKGQ